MESKGNLTPEQRSDVVQQYKNGYTVAQLTRKFGVTRPTIYKILNKANLTLKNEKFSENEESDKEMENTTFLGVTIDTINGPFDFKIKKALNRSASLLNIMDFIKVTKFRLNMTMFDYFWQVVVGNTPGHVARRVLEWFGYDGDYSEQKRLFTRMLNNNKINYRELTQKDEDIKLYPSIQQELQILPSNVTNSKFLIMEPRDLKMAIMQLKTKNGHIIRDYYIDLEELLKLYVEYTLYFNHRESQRKITNLEQMMSRMDLTMKKQEEDREKDRQIMLRQEQYMRSLGISLEEVKDQNEELLDNNKGLKKEVKKVQRKLGIAVEDRAPQPEDESKRERFVLLKRNDPEFMGYYTIRTQDAYTTKKLKTQRTLFPDLVVLLDFKCSPNSKTLYNRIKENLKLKNVAFKNNDIEIEDSQITEEELIDEMKAINDQKYNV
jgi:transcriptional regulator with XRE-family HTH domain